MIKKNVLANQKHLEIAAESFSQKVTLTEFYTKKYTDRFNLLTQEHLKKYLVFFF